MGQWAQWLRGEKGQGLVEYAFLLTLVALLVILSLSLFGTNLGELLEGIGDSFAGGRGRGWGQGIGGGRWK
ncbi:MAG: Flp family type IVb pilin [Nitrospinota bacterium]